MRVTSDVLENSAVVRFFRGNKCFLQILFLHGVLILNAIAVFEDRVIIGPPNPIDVSTVVRTSKNNLI